MADSVDPSGDGVVPPPFCESFLQPGAPYCLSFKTGQHQGGMMQTLAGRDRATEGRPNVSGEAPIDSASVRWVFAATLAFWLLVYVAGRALL